jgi:hypothetical protein
MLIHRTGVIDIKAHVDYMRELLHLGVEDGPSQPVSDWIALV